MSLALLGVGEVTAAPAYPANYLLYDTFTGADGTALTSHTPEVNVAGGGWTADTGTFYIQSNKATPNSNTAGDAVHAGASASDYTLTVDTVAQASDVSNQETPRFLFRETNSSNFYMVESDSAVGTINLYDVTAGTPTLLSSPTVSVASGASHSLKVVCVGNAIVVYWDNAVATAYASSVRASSTLVGLSFNKTGTPPAKVTWGNLLVTSTVPTTLISDGFSGTNGTSMASRTPDTTNTPGNTWTELSGTWVVNGSNQARKSVGSGGTNNQVAIELAQANCVLKVTVAVSVSLGAGVCARVTDDNNSFIALIVEGGQLNLYEHNGGGFTLRASGGTITTGTYAMTLVCAATTIAVTVGAAGTIHYHNATFNQTATKHGIFSNNTTSVFSAFSLAGL